MTSINIWQNVGSDMKVWLKLMSLIGFSLMMTICEAKENKKWSEADFVGVWSLHFNEEEELYGFTQVAFTTEGRKCVIGYSFDKKGQITMDYYDNTYKIEGKLMVTTYGDSTAKYSPKGFVIKDNIISVSENRFAVNLVEPMYSSTPEVHTRLENVETEQICQVVENYLTNHDFKRAEHSMDDLMKLFNHGKKDTKGVTIGDRKEN